MRILAIGDIHGVSTALDALLAAVQPAPQDLLIFLGDYVGRGPDTRGVLDRLLYCRQFGNARFLRGNHEIMMLHARQSRSELKNWLSVGGTQALASYSPVSGRSGSVDLIPQAHWDFLEQALIPFYETGQHIFVHANLEPATPLADQSERWLYWEFLQGPIRHVSGKVVICGHTTQNTGVPRAWPETIGLDTGAYRGGWLTCLDVNTRHYWQADVLGRVREGDIAYES